MELNNVKEGQLESLLANVHKCEKLSISGYLNKEDLSCLSSFVEYHSTNYLDISNTNVTEIERCSFYGCSNLKTISFPQTLKFIEGESFKGCSNLEYISLPKGLEKIGENAFQGCENLKEIIIPQGVKEISNGAFKGCSNLESIYLPKGLEKIGNDVFDKCDKLKDIQNLKDTGNFVFSFF